MSASFEKLQNRILSDARIKAEDIIRDAEEKARQMLQEAKIGAEKDADELLSKAQLEAQALKRSILSSKIRANRLRLLEGKNRIIQSVLRSVEDRLANITADEKFQDTMKRFVSEAIDAVGVEEPVVKVGFRNVSKRQVDAIGEFVPKGTKLIVQEQPVDGLGGVVASDPAGRFVYNNSFKARLDRLDNQLLGLISSTIFGE